MNARLLHSVLKHATVLANGATAEGDAILLRAFARDRDPAAFAELVRRYGRLVWSVCRQLRPTDADAEDAFQATFLVLVRSAGRIRTAALGPWLHTVACRIAGRAARSEGRRRVHEKSAAKPDRDAAVPPGAWEALTAAVHDEVAQLPESLRVPFVLCCLEGRGATEAAQSLGWKLGTLSGRLTRAKQELLGRLEKRGLITSAVAVAAFSVGPAVGAPVAVVTKALELVQPGYAIPSSILELAKGATTMTKTKLLAAMLLVAVGLAASVGAWRATAQDKPVYDEVKKLIDANDAALDLAAAIDLTRKRDEAKTKSAAKWEYHYLPRPLDANGKPAGAKPSEFETALESLEGDGWQFVGEVQVRLASTAGGEPPGNKTGVSLPTYVFRRPKGAAVKPATDKAGIVDVAVELPGRADAALLERVLLLEGSTDVRVPVARLAPVDDLGYVKNRLAELRDGKKPIRFEPAEFGVTALELQTVLQEAIQRKYNATADAAPIKLKRVTFPGSDFIEASGPTANLQWLKSLMDGAKTGKLQSR